MRKKPAANALATVPANDPVILDLPRGSYCWSERSREEPVAQAREPLCFSDAMLFIAAAAVLIELVSGRHGLAAGIVLFGGLLRLKLLLLDRISPNVPDWLLFAIPSAALWAGLYFLI